MEIATGKLVGILTGVMFASALVSFIVVKYQSEKDKQAIMETISAEFKKIGEAQQLHGNVVTEKDLEKKVKEAMGKEFADAVAKQNGTLTTLAMAVGQIQGQLAGLKPPTSGTKTEDGAFKDVVLEQNRQGAPALTSLKLDYDPKKPGLQGLQGQWNNNTEKFNIAYGQFKTDGGGQRAAVRLTREVFNGDKKVGQEEVPVVNGDFFITDKALSKIAPPMKYTLDLGATVDPTTHKVVPMGIVKKHWNKHFGTGIGIVNKQPAATISISW